MQTDIQYLGCSIFTLHMEGGVFFNFRPINFSYIDV